MFYEILRQSLASFANYAVLYRMLSLSNNFSTRITDEVGTSTIVQLFYYSLSTLLSFITCKQRFLPGCIYRLECMDLVFPCSLSSPYTRFSLPPKVIKLSSLSHPHISLTKQMFVYCPMLSSKRYNSTKTTTWLALNATATLLF